MVSVITIFLNAERFIAEAIESVLAQTYTDWELLLVDDGSTDNSPCTALAYTNRYPGRIRYLQHEGGINRGTSAARNLGVAHCGGEYLAFLDADDIWLPPMLERQVAILNAHPEVGMVQSLMKYWYSWSGLPEDFPRDHIDLGGLDFPLNAVVEPPLMFSRYFRIDGPGTMTLLIRKTAFEAVGGFEEIFTTVHDDAALILKMYLSVPVFVSSDCLGRYRRHPDSCCSQAALHRNWREDYLFFLGWLEGYFVTKGITDRSIWRTVNHQAWPLLHPQLYRWRPANVLGAVKRRLARLRGLRAFPIR